MNGGISDTNFIIQRSLFLAFCPISFFPPHALLTLVTENPITLFSHFLSLFVSILCRQEQKKEQLYYKDLFKSCYLTCFPAFRIVFLPWFLPSQYIRTFSSLNIYIHKALATGDIAVKFLLTSSIIFTELPLLILKFAVLLKVDLKKPTSLLLAISKFINPNKEQGESNYFLHSPIP